jgi:hypothetical protein
VNITSRSGKPPPVRVALDIACTVGVLGRSGSTWSTCAALGYSRVAFIIGISTGGLYKSGKGRRPASRSVGQNTQGSQGCATSKRHQGGRQSSNVHFPDSTGGRAYAAVLHWHLRVRSQGVAVRHARLVVNGLAFRISANRRRQSGRQYTSPRSGSVPPSSPCLSESTRRYRHRAVATVPRPRYNARAFPMCGASVADTHNRACVQREDPER